jgi:cytidyltransferase-like protein
MTFEDLALHRKQFVLADGHFDPLHQGHIRYLDEACVRGPLLCNIAPDSTLKHPPLLPADARKTILTALYMVDEVHVSTRPTVEILRQVQPTHYIKGADWEGRLPVEQVETCAELCTEIVFLDTVVESSSALLERYQRADVAAFEALVQGQVPFDAAHYDSAYFTGAWRKNGNAYDLETRRRIEGKHPALIKDVFQPKQVLDVGAGPGALLQLLAELGVLGDGMDFADDSGSLLQTVTVAAAKKTALDRYGNGMWYHWPVDISGPDVSMPIMYDLVICREVMEHLTVPQLRKAVSNLVMWSTHYIYVTTRYCAAPTSLLSVDTSDDLDPSHISLMTKDFLRTLFILEGCTSRPDLEARMDWQGQGRCLVMEIPHASRPGTPKEAQIGAPQASYRHR